MYPNLEFHIKNYILYSVYHKSKIYTSKKTEQNVLAFLTYMLLFFIKKKVT